MNRSQLSMGAVTLLVGALWLVGCSTVGTRADASPPADNDREVTVLIALSAVVPAGIVGHAGIAVDDQFYDFGPERVDRYQRLQGFGSPAGPWWDDPDQAGQIDYTLSEVLSQLDEKVYPEGSLIAVARIPATAEQAEQIAAYWDAVYVQMQSDQRVYHLLGEQCANVIAASMTAAPGRVEAGHAPPVPPRMWGMSPTRLYRWLNRQSRLASAGRGDLAVQITLYQQRDGRIEPYAPRLAWSRFGVPVPVRLVMTGQRLRNLVSHAAMIPR